MSFRSYDQSYQPHLVNEAWLAKKEAFMATIFAGSLLTLGLDTLGNHELDMSNHVQLLALGGVALATASLGYLDYCWRVNYSDQLPEITED